MKKLTLISLLALVSLAFLSSCQKEENVLPVKKEMNGVTPTAALKEGDPVFCGSAYTTNLMAGQNIVAGTVTIQNTSSDLYVTVNTVNGWMINLVHLYAGSLSNAPVNGAGNPQPGQFPYVQSFQPLVNEYTFIIPLQNLDPCFIVALHAEVKKFNQAGQLIQSETAWGQGIRFSNKNWGMYMEYCPQICCEITPRYFDMIADGKEAVGKLTLINDETMLYATITTTGQWFIQDVSAYAGALQDVPHNGYGYPEPGLFPKRDNFQNGTQMVTYAFPLDHLSDCYIVAASARVGKISNGNFYSMMTAWSSGQFFPVRGSFETYSPYCTQVCK